MANHYEVPNWWVIRQLTPVSLIIHKEIIKENMFMSLFTFRAGKPPIGLHLDVLKGDKLIQVMCLHQALSLKLIDVSVTRSNRGLFCAEINGRREEMLPVRPQSATQ